MNEVEERIFDVDCRGVVVDCTCMHKQGCENEGSPTIL